jgi:hypothetical protein
MYQKARISTIDGTLIGDMSLDTPGLEDSLAADLTWTCSAKPTFVKQSIHMRKVDKSIEEMVDRYPGRLNSGLNAFVLAVAGVLMGSVD